MTKTIKVLLVSPCQGVYGGMEAFVLTLAKFLATQTDCRPRLCFKKVTGFELQPQLLSMCEASQVNYTFVDKGSHALAQQIIWSHVVHGQNTSPDVIALARLFDKKLVLTIHNRFISVGLLHEVAWRLGAKLAHQRWYNSNFVWNTWETESKLAGSSRIPTVSNLPEGVLPIRERSGFTFAARWIANKGLTTLVKAYARAELNPKQWPLHLLGDGPLRPEIEQFIQQQRIPGIKIHGFVNEETKAQRIRASRWMVIPPHTQEDLGLTAIEARNVGVPCIITRDGGLPEAAGAQALICQPNDVHSLTQLLKTAATMSEDEYKHRSEATRLELEHYLKPLSFYSQAYHQLSELIKVELTSASNTK